MNETIQAYPLQWPAAWPRTADPEYARFKVTFAVARDELLYELELLGATDIVLSTNIELRRDGLPYANRPEPADPGVAVYFTYNGQPRCIPCDRWIKVHDNMRAIGLTVAALRGLDRWGAGGMVDAAFSGFAALPASGTSGEDPYAVLGVHPEATWGEVQEAYRRLAKQHHPDAGGNTDDFLRIKHAFEQIRPMR